MVHEKEKVLEILLDDPNKPKIIILYTVNTNYNNAIHDKKRTVLIRNDLIEKNDLTSLDVANKLHSYLHEEMEFNVKKEQNLLGFYVGLKKNKKWNGYFINERKIPLKEYKKNGYQVYDRSIFEKVALKIQIEATRKNQKN